MAEVKQIWCEEDKKFYPETKTENGRRYKLDPTTFVYLEQMELGLTAEEQELMNEPIGQWGEKWRKLMEEMHPERIPSLQGRLLWKLIPRQIDSKAWELRQTLKTQYAKKTLFDRVHGVDSVGEHIRYDSGQRDNGNGSAGSHRVNERVSTPMICHYS